MTGHGKWWAVFCLLMLLMGCSDEGHHEVAFTNVEPPALQKVVTAFEMTLTKDLDAYFRLVSVAGREAYFFDGSDYRYTADLMEGNEAGAYFLAHASWNARDNAIATGEMVLAQLPNFELEFETVDAVTGWVQTLQAYQTLLNLTLSYDYGLPAAKDTPGLFHGYLASLDRLAEQLDDAHTLLLSGAERFPMTLGDGFAMFDTPTTFAQFNRAIAARVHAYRADGPALMEALDQSFLDNHAPLRIGAFHVYRSATKGGSVNPLFEPHRAERHRWMVHPNMIEGSEEGDQRVSAKVRATTHAQTWDGLSSQWIPKVAFAPNAPLPIIHNEELMLLRAEGLLLTGELYDAEDVLNQLRADAGIERLWLTDDEEGWQALERERKVALFLEGHRWIDARRFGTLPDLPLDRDFGVAGPLRGPDRHLYRIAPPL